MADHEFESKRAKRAKLAVLSEVGGAYALSAASQSRASQSFASVRLKRADSALKIVIGYLCLEETGRTGIK